MCCPGRSPGSHCRAGLLTLAPYSSFTHISLLYNRKPILRKLESMIPYMDLNEQVDADFTRARRRARLRALVARIRREHASNRLLSFDDVRREHAANNRFYRGTRVVEMEEIVGSVGRWRDFDRSFLPARASMAERWKRIDRAFQRARTCRRSSYTRLGMPTSSWTATIETRWPATTTCRPLRPQ